MSQSTIAARSGGDDLLGLQWRRLDERLWAARLDDQPAGTIEQWRSFVYVGLDGDRHDGYRTLDEAKKAAPELLRCRPVGQEGPEQPLTWARVAGAAAFAACVLAVVWLALNAATLA